MQAATTSTSIMFPDDTLFQYTDLFDNANEASSSFLFQPSNNNNLQLLFRRARANTYFLIQTGQEMNSSPYKYNLRLEHAQPNQQYQVGLFVQGEPHQHDEFVPHGLRVHKYLVQSSHVVEIRIELAVFSYNFGNRMFCIKVHDAQNALLAETRPFEILARRNRKRNTSNKSTLENCKFL